MVLPGANASQENSGSSRWWQPSQQRSPSQSWFPSSLSGLLKWRIFPILIIASFLGLFVTFLYAHTRGSTIHGKEFTTHIENVIEAQVLHTNLGGNNFEHRYFLFDSELEEDVEISWFRSWKSLYRPATLGEILAAAAMTRDPEYIQVIEDGFTEGIELLYDFSTEVRKGKRPKHGQGVLAALEPDFRMLSYSFASSKWVRQSFRGKKERVEQDKRDRFRATYHFLEHTGLGELQMLQEKVMPYGKKRDACLKLALYLFVSDTLIFFENEKKQKPSAHHEEGDEKNKKTSDYHKGDEKDTNPGDYYEEGDENEFESIVFSSWVANKCGAFASLETQSDNTAVLDVILHTVIKQCADADDLLSCKHKFRTVFPKAVEKFVPNVKSYLSGCDAGLLLIISQQFSQTTAKTLASLIRSSLTPEGLVCNVDGNHLVFPFFQQSLQNRIFSLLDSKERSILEGTSGSLKATLQGLRQRKAFEGYPVFVKVSPTTVMKRQVECLWCTWYLRSVPSKMGEPLIQSLSQPLAFNVTTRVGSRTVGGQAHPSVSIPKMSGHLHSQALGGTLKNSTFRASSSRERRGFADEELWQDISTLLLGVPPANFIRQWRHNEIQRSHLQNLENCEIDAEEWFHCDDSRKISCEKVNDGLCDCPSTGADEPSTGACSHHRIPQSLRMKSSFVLGHHFWCKGGVSKEKFSRPLASLQEILNGPESIPACEPLDEPLPQAYKSTGGFDHRHFIIPSSKVGDGICDCVYGEDEREYDEDVLP